MQTKETLVLRKAKGEILGRQNGIYGDTKLFNTTPRKDKILNKNLSIADQCHRFYVSRNTLFKFSKRHPSISQAWTIKEKQNIPTPQSIQNITTTYFLSNYKNQQTITTN